MSVFDITRTFFTLNAVTLTYNQIASGVARKK